MKLHIRSKLWIQLTGTCLYITTQLTSDSTSVSDSLHICLLCTQKNIPIRLFASRFFKQNIFISEALPFLYIMALQNNDSIH